MATENCTDVLNNVSNLEVLAQMGKKALTSIKNIGKGYASEQLASTFNIPGVRFAEKYLNAELFGDPNTRFGEVVGNIIGFHQDLLTTGVGIPVILQLQQISFDEPRKIPYYITGLGVLTGIKIVTNIGAFIGSKLYDRDQSAKKHSEASKIKNEQSDEIN